MKNKQFQNGGFYNYRPPLNGKHKKPYVTLNILRLIFWTFLRKPKVVWQTEVPTEPVLYVCNHTKIYAPSAIVLYYRNIRLWANASFMNYKECWHQMMDKVLKKRKYLIPLAILIMPFEVIGFRQMEHIPVYRDTRVRDTFSECSKCLQSGRSAMVFAEKYDGEMANKYLYKLQSGYIYSAQKYYLDTGKIMKIYPVYCAESLRTFVVGQPVEYDPNKSVKAQTQYINESIENRIGELGDSLPEHKITLYK